MFTYLTKPLLRFGIKDKFFKHGLLKGSVRGIRNQHPFDTYKFVKRLEDRGFNQIQSAVIMQILYSMINEKGGLAKREILSKADLEKGQYLFKSALTELRTEIQLLRKNDQSILNSEMDQIRKEIDILIHIKREGINQLKLDLQMDLNAHNHDMNYLNKTIDFQMHDVANQYHLQLSQLRTEIEAMKWESIRKGIMMVFFASFFLTLISFLVRKGQELTDEVKVPNSDEAGVLEGVRWEVPS